MRKNSDRRRERIKKQIKTVSKERLNIDDGNQGKRIKIVLIIEMTKKNNDREGRKISSKDDGYWGNKIMKNRG